MADITVNLWQDFNFDTLTVENLAANDHSTSGSWSIIDLNSRLSTNSAAEKVSSGTINGNLDQSGTHGMVYESPAAFDPARIIYQFSTRKATASIGFWFKFPAEYVGSFEGGQPDILVVRNILGTNELYVKLTDNNAGNIYLFTVESNYSGNIPVDPDTWYWITVVYGPTTHRLRVYDEEGNQVGSEQTRPGAGAEFEEASTVSLGSLIGDNGGGGPFYFDDLVMDWSDATFPLGPPLTIAVPTILPTLLEITNKVLLRLREDQVDDLSDPYAALIASFVADTVAELNEATIWNFLDHEVTVDVLSGTQSYALTGTNNMSHILWNSTGPACWIFDDDEAPAGTQMIYLDPSDFYRRYQSDRDNTSAKPQWFTIEKDTDNADLYIRLWPVPNADAHLRIRFNTPEEELDPETDADTEIYMPERLVRLGALMLALNERGEEIGEPGNIAETRYIMAKGAAVENEIRARERSGFYDWVRV